MRWLASLLLVAVFISAAAAQDEEQAAERRRAAHAERPRQINRGDLQGNMQLLNLWGEQPETVQRLYAAAYKVLAAGQDEAFTDLARDAEVQRLAAEAGVTHFGGPMLGDVRPDGAAVWLRTLRPAVVEVRVTVDGQEQSFGPVASTDQTDLSAVVRVTGLQPGTRYPYRVLVDGKPINVAAAGTLVTAPVAGTGKVRIVFGSCFHRWGAGQLPASRDDV